jgi:hypothetical protein
MGKVNLKARLQVGIRLLSLQQALAGRVSALEGFGSGQAFARSAAHLLVLQKHSRRQQLLPAN